MGKLKQNIAREGANGYVGDDPHKVQPTKAPTSSDTNTVSSTQTKKKKATGYTGSGVNIV